MTAAADESASQTDAPARGRNVDKPAQFGLRAWRDIGTRLWKQLARDRVGLIAAGVTFYTMLALIPGITAFVSLYGLVTDPLSIQNHISMLAGLAPPSALDLLRDELERITSAGTGTLGLSFALALGVALWSANNGVKALFQAMNVAYDEEEKRSFVKLLLLSFGFTLSIIVVTAIVINAVVIIPAVFDFIGLAVLTSTVGALVPALSIFLLVNLGIAALYRVGASRRRAKWRWITWGSVLASLIWLIGSFAFALYLANWGDYNATYGSLGTIMGLMMWIYISSYVVIVGAELNAEMEHQTRKDSTVGPDRPMGERGAYVADTLGGKT